MKGVNIKTLKKIPFLNNVKLIEKDNIYYIGYTNYKIWINYHSNKCNVSEWLESKGIDFILQDTFQCYHILRIKSDR